MEIQGEINEMQAFLEVIYSDDPNEMAGRLTELNVYMARSGSLLADAKLLQDQAMARSYSEHLEEIKKLPATIANKFISSHCGEINHFVNRLDRINRACVHQSDNIRTQLSFAKEQMSLIRKGY